MFFGCHKRQKSNRTFFFFWEWIVYGNFIPYTVESLITQNKYSASPIYITLMNVVFIL